MYYKTGKTKIIEQVERLYDVQFAILGFIGSLTDENEVELQRSLKQLKTIEKKRLIRHLEKLKKHILELRRRYGLKVSDDEVVKIWGSIKPLPSKDCWVPKWYLAKIFSSFENAFPIWNHLPMHAMIEGAKLSRQKGDRRREYFIYEASLYENMCALYNLGHQSYFTEPEDAVDKIRIKAGRALYHSVTTTAYYFLEAYLNGLAYDHWLTAGDGLSAKQIDQLLEWQIDQNRPSPLTLREKLLQYPRIVTKAAHPPLTESNCAEMHFVIDRVKPLRDAIAHGSPKHDPNSHDFTKLREILARNWDDVGKIVDSIVVLARKVEIAARGDDRMLFWLKDRGADGYFPPEVFD